jgi:predicted CXXCH cytochrome family protein
VRDCRIITLLFILVVGGSFLISGCGKDQVVTTNQLPTGSLSMTSDSIDAGETDTVTANYTDPDGDDLSYSWTANSGRLFNSDSSTVVWNAPSRNGIYTFYVWVSDGVDSVQDSTRVYVGAITIPLPPYASSYIGYDNCGNCHTEQLNGPSIIDGWAETGHAEAFTALTDAGQGTNDNCLPCHTTGWNTNVVNGGYDEVRFPDLEAVQCEVCHHPGSEHWFTIQTDDSLQGCINTNCHPNEDPLVYQFGNRDSIPDGMGGYYSYPHPDPTWPEGFDTTMVFSINETQCAECHDNGHYPYIAQWDSSGHSQSLNAAGALGCGTDCHTSFGYLDRLFISERGDHTYPVQPDSAFDPDSIAVTCLTCHGPHFFKHDGQIRESAGALCKRCHQADALETVGESPIHVHMAMFRGTGGYEYPGSSYENSEHATVLKIENCSACHVSKVTSDGDGYASNTPHGFKAALSNCTAAACHPSATNFNIDGVQDSVMTLVTALTTILNDNIADSASVEYKQAKFNMEFVRNDSSWGVHNSNYAFKLLNDAISNYP